MNDDVEIWNAIRAIIKDLAQLQQAVKELTEKINERKY